MSLRNLSWISVGTQIRLAGDVPCVAGCLGRASARMVGTTIIAPTNACIVIILMQSGRQSAVRMSRATILNGESIILANQGEVCLSHKSLKLCIVGQRTSEGSIAIPLIGRRKRK